MAAVSQNDWQCRHIHIEVIGEDRVRERQFLHLYAQTKRQREDERNLKASLLGEKKKEKKRQVHLMSFLFSLHSTGGKKKKFPYSAYRFRELVLFLNYFLIHLLLLIYFTFLTSLITRFQ